MAHTKRHKKTGRCPKGKRGKACRKRRRGLGDYDSANAAMQARASSAAVENDCHRNNTMRVSAGLSPRPCGPTPAAVKASKKRAKAEGCKAPKGRVCVDKTVAKIGTSLRKGCKKSKVPGAYTCTPNALKQKDAGKNVKASKRAPSGFKYVTFRAGTTADGTTKRGCKLHRSRIVCPKGMKMKKSSSRKKKAA